LKALAHRFMGGRPCALDLSKIANGKSDVSMDGETNLHHGETFKFSCDKNYFSSGSQMRTCIDGTISPSLEEDPLACNEGARSCDQLKDDDSSVVNGVYDIKPFDNSSKEVEVYCDMQDEHGWIVIQRRLNNNVSFSRGWDEYLEGFGDIKGNYWMGLRRMCELLKTKDYILRIDLEGKLNSGYAEYGNFYLGSEEEKFPLTVGNYSGNAGDSFEAKEINRPDNGRSAQGMQFSTFDQDNDQLETGSCSGRAGLGGWWYNSCTRSALNGLYLKDDVKFTTENGLNWYSFDRTNYLVSAQMKIRRKTENE